MLITLDVYGFWDDDSVDGCHGVQLFVNGKNLWKSCLYDSFAGDLDDYHENIQHIRDELEEALEQFGVPVKDIVCYDSNCIHDWELNYETEV